MAIAVIWFYEHLRSARVSYTVTVTKRCLRRLQTCVLRHLVSRLIAGRKLIESFLTRGQILSIQVVGVR